jgi:hypothetical protein
MYILTIAGREQDGAYSVVDDDGDDILYLFQEEDDATRYALLLEEDGHPEMHIIEVEDRVMMKTCEMHGYQYILITPDDIVIPPNTDYDFI